MAIISVFQKYVVTGETQTMDYILQRGGMGCPDEDPALVNETAMEELKFNLI